MFQDFWQTLYASYVDKVYRKVASMIKCFGRARIDITPVFPETIYKVMILPIFLYFSNINI